MPRLLQRSVFAAAAFAVSLISAKAFPQGDPPAKPVEAAKVAQSAPPDSAALATLGRALALAGRHREACEHFALAIASLPRAASDDERDALAKDLADSKKLVATIVVRLDEDVASATLLLDGAEVGTFPQRRPIYAEPGKHTLTAESVGRRFSIVSFEVAAGKNVIVPLPEYGRTSPRAIEKPIWPTIALASVAGVGLAVGIGTLAASFARESDASDLGDEIRKCNLNALSGKCLELSSIVSARNQLRDASTITFVASGVALGALVAYVLVPAPENDLEAPRPVQQALRSLSITPGLSTTGAGLVVAGAF